MSEKQQTGAPAGIPEEGIKEKDPILVEINKKIETAFDIFDHESNKTVDVRYNSISPASSLKINNSL